MDIKFKNLKFIVICSFVLTFLCSEAESYAAGNGNSNETALEMEAEITVPGESAKIQDEDNVCALYQEYRSRFENIEDTWNISGNGFEIVENQIFPIELSGYGEVSVVPAFFKGI